MLKKALRLHTGEFKQVFTRGKEKKYHYFLVKWMDEQESARFGVAVSKKLQLSAVERNKSRRVIYSCIKKTNDYMNGKKWVIFMLIKKNTAENKNMIEEEISKIIHAI